MTSKCSVRSMHCASVPSSIFPLIAELTNLSVMIHVNISDSISFHRKTHQSSSHFKGQYLYYRCCNFNNNLCLSTYMGLLKVLQQQPVVPVPC